MRMTSLLIYWIGLPLTILLLGSIPVSGKNATLEGLADNYISRVPVTEESKTREVVRIKYADLSKFCNNTYTMTLDICWKNKTTKHFIGICYPLPTFIGRDRYRMAIEIDIRMKGMSKLYLEELIWHEMAHCQHGIGHPDNLLLMSPRGMNSNSVNHLRRMQFQYIEEIKLTNEE